MEMLHFVFSSLLDDLITALQHNLVVHLLLFELLVCISCYCQKALGMF